MFASQDVICASCSILFRVRIADALVIKLVVTMILLYFVNRYIFKNSKKAGLQELGPRFTLKLRSLQRGTFDSKFGEYEWIHKVSARDVKHT